MKREIHLFDQITEYNNLTSAVGKALKGKRQRPDAIAFCDNLSDELDLLSCRVRNGGGPIGSFREFVIHDPKKRTITAPCFADRVLHHAIMNVCERGFERWLIGQSFACRKGLGLRAAISEARRRSSNRRWYLQLDVRHYFETIPRSGLLTRVERLFGEPEMLNLWFEIIFAHRSRETHGMPIGALTSQFLANYYLGFLDRLIKEQLRIRGYARYMDDMVLWHDDKETLLGARDEIEAFASQDLGLTLKPPLLNRTSGGMDFLGFRFHPGWIGLSRSSRRRLKLRLRGYEKAWAEGKIGEAELSQRATAALAFVAPAQCIRVKRQLAAESGYY